jgi:beta-glucuronidase
MTLHGARPVAHLRRFSDSIYSFFNRQPVRLEIIVTRRKQTTAAHFHRQLSGTSSINSPARAALAVAAFLIAAILFPSASAAQAVPSPANLIANIPARNTISLSGVWQVIVDPYETGLSDRFYENRQPKDKQDLVEYNFDASGTLKVPGDWNSQRESLLLYEGPLWYKKSFSYQKRPHTRTFIYFGAANYRARVYLNGRSLGEHEGGFTSFNFEITDTVREGDNFVVVEVNDARRADAVPALNTDWWNYGGLTRDVTIVEVPETFIQDYFLQLAKGSTGEIAGWVKLTGASEPQKVTLEIPEANITQQFTTDRDGYVEFRFAGKLSLWSPENPKLYRVVVSAAGDRIEDQIGFRTIETSGTKILLNGQPVFLRGISMHEEAAFRGGRAFSPEDDAVLLGWAKELGCNFVRLAHYQYNESMIRMADRMGILVWEEVPVYWGIDWTNPATLQVAEEQMRDLIARDHNRAAAILWSVGNETPMGPDRLEFLRKLAAYARSLDSTRLLTSAMNHRKNIGGNTQLLDDPLGEFLDVLGENEYIGWYETPVEATDTMQWKSTYDKPVIFSEFGAGAPYGDHGDAGARWTEEYQASLYQHQINMLKRIPALAGMSPWVLMDFRSPRRMLAGVQDFYNRKGLISDRGQRKQAFYVLQNFYRSIGNSKPE